MKMRKPHSVPLSDAALTLLAELRELTGWGELLFPSQSSSKKPISENTLNQALRRMGFGPDEVTSHGFRSTFTTFSNESGLWNPDAIESYCARQDSNAVRRAYNRSQYWDERIKIADWWSEELKFYAKG
jgi:integrase